MPYEWLFSFRLNNFMTSHEQCSIPINSGANFVPRLSLTPGAGKKRGPGKEVAVVPS